jgi:hypothetical protein
VGQEQPAGVGGGGGGAGPLTGQVHAVDRVVAALVEGCFAKEDIAVAGGLLQSAAGVGVSGIGQGVQRRAAVRAGAVRLDPQRVGLVRWMPHRVGRDGERSDADRLAAVPAHELKVLVHPRIRGQAVRGGHPVRGVLRSPDLDPVTVPSGRVPVHRHVQAAQIHAVVRMKVRQEDGVDVAQVHVALQRAQ